MKHSIVLSVQPSAFRAATFKGDLERNLSRIAGLGYDGVELAIRDPNPQEADALFAAVERYGLELPAIGTGQAWGEDGISFTHPDPAVRREAVARIGRHMPLAARAGAFIVLGLIRGVVQDGVDRRRARDWMVESLERCCEEATARGVRFVLEPIHARETTFVHTVAEACALADRLDTACLGLLADTYHMHHEETSVAGGLRAAGPRLLHVHVADSNRHHPGAGSLDFAAILGLLDELGYRGYVSGEFLPEPDSETAARKAIEHLKRVYRAQERHET